MKKKCPKCGYVRGENEIAQEYECPKCEIVYAKYEAVLNKKRIEEMVKPSPDATILVSAEGKGIKIQNFIMLIMGSVVTLMIMFPPFSVNETRGTYNAGYAFILNPPDNGYATVNSSMLLVEIIVCMLLGCIPLFILKNSEKRLWTKKTKKLFHKKDIRDSPSAASKMAIWNPNSASNWSILLSPVFGSYIHTLNWRTLGETEKASSAFTWFWVSVVFFLALPFGSVLSLDISKPSNDPATGLGLLYLIIWYFAAGREQTKYVKSSSNNYPRRGWTKPLLLGFLCWFLYFIYAVMIGTVLGWSLGTSAAKDQVISEAIFVGAPTGLLGAEWLMSQNEVSSIRPSAVRTEPNVIAEQAVVFGRNADIAYHFQDNSLILIIATFSPPSHPSTYASTQKVLAETYGDFPPPKRSDDYVLYTERVTGRFTFMHFLSVVNNVSVEQVMLFRGKEK